MYHPYAHYYPHYRRFNFRPSRIVWFAIGAFAATWFHRSRYEHRALWYADTHNTPVNGIGQDLPAAPPAIAHPYPASPRPFWSRQNPMDDRTWEERKSKMKEFGQRAQETVAGVTESTLDGVFTAIEVLKVKLADHQATAERAVHLRRMEEEGKLVEQQNRDLV